MRRSASFLPFIRVDAKLLILGSLPGQVSLTRRQYYAHPQNQFWRLIGAVIGHELISLEYESRLDALATAGVGLWDVIGTAMRIGSLDSAIRNHETNDLTALITRLPRLAAIGFNGAAAYKLGNQQLEATGIPLVALPSSSPAYAAMPFTAKREAWLTLQAFLA